MDNQRESAVLIFDFGGVFALNLRVILDPVVWYGMVSSLTRLAKTLPKSSVEMVDSNHFSPEGGNTWGNVRSLC